MEKRVKILFFSESRYPVDRKKLRKITEELLQRENVQGPVEISLAIVGDRKMKKLNLKYRNIEKTTDVLSFSIMEGKSTVLPPDGVLRLGDVIISYPQAVKSASIEEKLVDEKIEELVEHGLEHLLGIHHE